MKILKAIDEHLEEWLLVFTLSVMSLLTFLQVVMRFCFSSSLTWSEEAVRYLFLWMVWLGASFATKRHAHMRIEVLPSALSSQNRAKLNIFVNVVWLVFSIYMMKLSIALVSMLQKSRQLSPALRIPMWVPYLSVTIGFSLMNIRLIQDIAVQASLAKGGEEKRK